MLKAAAGAMNMRGFMTMWNNVDCAELLLKLASLARLKTGAQCSGGLIWRVDPLRLRSQTLLDLPWCSTFGILHRLTMDQQSLLAHDCS
jgi:hypothetical protein